MPQRRNYKEESRKESAERWDRLLTIAVIWALISTGGYFAGAVADAEVRLSLDPQVQAWLAAKDAWSDIRAVSLQFGAGTVPEDLSILLDEAELYFGSELGLALNDALTMGADLPPDQSINSLSEGQQRDANYAAASIGDASELIEAELHASWERIPAETRQLIERNNGIVIGSLISTLLSGLLGFAADIKKRSA